MGYHTDFEGRFSLDKPLTLAHANYLKKFSETRRMSRNAKIAETLDDPVRIAVDLPIGVGGEYFVGGTGFMGQDHDKSVTNSNRPPANQYGLWCQWIPSDCGNYIEWDTGEKFYHYTEWLEYIVEHFLKPWGYTLNGSVQWDGEERGDIGTITVEDNVVRVTSD